MGFTENTRSADFLKAVQTRILFRDRRPTDSRQRSGTSSPRVVEPDALMADGGRECPPFLGSSSDGILMTHLEIPAPGESSCVADLSTRVPARNRGSRDVRP